MKRTLLCRLNALAWSCLGKIPAATSPVEVTASDGTTELVIAARPAGHVQLEPGGIPAMFFSPLELQVVELLVGASTMKQVTIGRKCGQTDGSGQASVYIRDVLRNLRDRGILDHDDDGFRLQADAQVAAQKWGIGRTVPAPMGADGMERQDV